MGAASKVLAPVVIVAAVARSRRKAAADPDSDERSSGSAQGTGPSARSSAPASASDVPGAGATRPTGIPAAGWKQVLKRARAQVKEDNVGLMAAGVAFYLFLALFPALIAAVTLYGLVADPQQVEEQIANLTDALPEDSASLISGQLQDITSTSSQALGFGLVISVAAALFSASAGVQNLVKAVNIAYDEQETRGAIRLRGLALLMTVSAVLFLTIAVGLVAVLPVALEAAGLGVIANVAVQVVRWVGLVVFVMVALALLYRYAPDRDAPRLTWVGLGSIVATLLWVAGSAGFSLYVSSFGNYGKTYGALAGVVVLMLWLFLTSFVILLGAEINSETEQQTARDTTRGPEQPMGQRDAVKADTMPSGG